jgi:outer membrane protein
MRVNQAMGFLGLAAVLLWATAAQDEAVKVGVVDLDQAINATEQGKQAREELARKQREAESTVQPLIDRFKDLQEEIKSKRFVLSEEALFEKQLDLAELQNQIQNKLKEIEGQLKVDRERLEAPLRVKLGTIVEEIGKTQGFTMILARGYPGLLYTREALDITDMVIQKFNKKG